MGRDLAAHKGRSALVVLSVAIGVFAVGMIAGSRTVLARGLQTTYLAANPPSASIRTFGGFDDDLVGSIAALPEVALAEGRRQVMVRMATGPDAYRDLQLIAVPDYTDMRVRVVKADSGPWPPADRTLYIERSAVGLMDVAPGDDIEVKAPSGRVRTLHVAGIVHDVTREPAFVEGLPFAFVTFPTLEWLGEDDTYNELNVVAATGRDDKDHVTAVGDLVRDKVERSGHAVLFLWVPEPGRHPLDSILDTVLFLLGSLGGLALLLSGFLVTNTVSALVAQQTRQIGMMKAIGGRRDQIAALYLGMVLTFGALSLGLALPLGALGAYGLSNYMASLLNVDLPPFRMPPWVLATQIAVALLVPAVAASFPVASGIRVTVREAMTSYGLGKGHFGTSRIDQALRRVRGLPRPLLLSLRNTFRRKGRLALTMTTLSLAGATFIAVFAVKASMAATLDAVLQLWQYDVLVQFDRPYRADRVLAEAQALPEVASAEAWGFDALRFRLPEDTESDSVIVFAAPADTQLLHPEVLDGRWLETGDENALVLNTLALKQDPGLKVGDEVKVTLQGEEQTFRYVGLIQAPGRDPFAYVNYPYYGRLTDSVGRADSLLVVGRDRTTAGQEATARALEAHFRKTGVRVSSVLRITQEIEEAEASFGILVALLMVMAVLLAAVGGLGLAGTMSLNVIERTREIGVLRAIGASHHDILRIVLAEGIILGVLSGALGAVLAYPLGRALSDAVGRTFLDAPLKYTYPPSGALLWLGLVLALAAAASALPAWSATRVSVREVLAYE